jgi:hypothetical protein
VKDAIISSERSSSPNFSQKESYRKLIRRKKIIVRSDNILILTRLEEKSLLSDDSLWL